MAIATARARDRPHAECDQEDRPPLLHPAPVQVAKVVRQQHSADDDEDDAAPTHANLTRSIATGNGRSPPKRKKPRSAGLCRRERCPVSGRRDLDSLPAARTLDRVADLAVDERE